MFMSYTDEREDLRSVPDVDIARLVQSVEKKKQKNLSEEDLCQNTFKKIDEDGIFNPGKYTAFYINSRLKICFCNTQICKPTYFFSISYQFK